jgi:MFS family permease
MGLFYIGAPISFILGGPVSGLLLLLDGLYGRAGWQWLFLVEGLLASVVGVVALFYLSDGPDTTRWLSAAEKIFLRDQLAAERTAGGGTPKPVSDTETGGCSLSGVSLFSHPDDRLWTRLLHAEPDRGSRPPQGRI